ncbi:MAG: pilus assembly protein [Blastocatellia bacterium]|nr:pilus assembly protein [Blastocatellia bacterium]
MSGLNAFLKRERGQGMAELALVLPVTMLLIVGAVELGRFLMIRQVVLTAAREGARMAILPTTRFQSEVEAIVRQWLRNGDLDPARAHISVSGLRASTGAPTTVEVRYPFDSVLFRMIRRSEAVTVRGVSTMLHE